LLPIEFENANLASVKWNSIQDQNMRSVDISVEQQWGSIKQAFKITAEEVLGRNKAGKKA